MNRVLLLSQNFPPSTIASVHRCRHLAKHLPTFGWHPTVLAVDERFHKEPPDQGLATLVPDSVDVVRVRSLPLRPLNRLGIGDLSLRSYPFIRHRLSRLLAAEKYDMVFITGWPFYHMLLTGWIRRRWNVPVVLDFQDPWVPNTTSDARGWSKAELVRCLAAVLEPGAVKNASFITSVSDRQNDEMAARYPWLDRTRMAGIPIGGDPEDFDALRNAALESKSATDQAIFSYAGTALPRATPLFRALFRGLARLRADKPALAARLHLQFIGTSNQPNDATTFRVRPVAEAEGVADLVTEKPARVPFLDALRILATTDAVLMIGSDEPHYTASKIYPALMSGRPFLSIFHRMSSAHEILTRAGGGVALAFETQDELDALVPVVADGLARLAADPSALGRIDPTAYAPFTAHAVAGRFAQVFERAEQRRGSTD